MTHSRPSQDAPWAVATPHSAASAAGAEVLASGGNAVDAALAAAAVLTVVYPNQCSLGGDAFALVTTAGGPVRLVNGTGRAPAALDVDDLRRRGPSMPVSGASTVTVPGVVSGWEALATGWGTRPLASALAGAGQVAADGVPVSPGLARDLAAEASLLAEDAGAREVFFRAGVPLRAGEVLRQPRLAESLRALAESGPGALYGGEVGRSLVAALADAPGAMTLEDLRAHRADLDDPLSVRFGDVEYVSSGANSQGTFFLEGLAALDVLARRQGRVPDPLGGEAGAVARILSASAVDRDRLLGDPAHTDLPVERLLSPEHAEDLATWAVGGQPLPAPPLPGGPAVPGGRRSGDTVAVVVADGRGGWVSLIQSVFHAFGAALLDPGTGILLHNRGASFSLDPGSPNVAAPGRRPLHTLMPVLVRRQGRVVAAHGTMGGRAQHQIHTHLALHLAAGLSASDAVSAPRWILGRMEAGSAQQDADHTVSAEAGVPRSAVADLERAGFRTVHLPPLDDGAGHAQVVRCDGDGGVVAATDPRADGVASTGAEHL